MKSLLLLMAPIPRKVSVVYMVCFWYSDATGIATDFLSCNAKASAIVLSNVRFHCQRERMILLKMSPKHCYRYCLELRMWSSPAAWLVITANVVLVSVIAA